MNSKGQAFVEWPQIIIALLFCLTMALILAQVMPSFIGNFLAPSLTGTQSGDITIFLWYFLFPALIIIILFVAAKNIFGSGGG